MSPKGGRSRTRDLLFTRRPQSIALNDKIMICNSYVDITAITLILDCECIEYIPETYIKITIILAPSNTKVACYGGELIFSIT
jgi:hypothetical protein